MPAPGSEAWRNSPSFRKGAARRLMSIKVAQRACVLRQGRRDAPADRPRPRPPELPSRGRPPGPRKPAPLAPGWTVIAWQRQTATRIVGTSATIVKTPVSRRCSRDPRRARPAGGDPRRATSRSTQRGHDEDVDEVRQQNETAARAGERRIRASGPSTRKSGQRQNRPEGHQPERADWTASARVLRMRADPFQQRRAGQATPMPRSAASGPAGRCVGRLFKPLTITAPTRMTDSPPRAAFQAVPILPRACCSFTSTCGAVSREYPDR